MYYIDASGIYVRPKSSVMQHFECGKCERIIFKILHRIVTYNVWVTINKNIPLFENPIWVQTTLASWASNRSSHIVPQALLMHISTLPSRILAPPTNLNCPSVQLAYGVVIARKDSRWMLYAHTLVSALTFVFIYLGRQPNHLQTGHTAHQYVCC